MDTLELYAECSGLKVNIEKTKAIWLGNKSTSKDILLPERKLNWVTDEPFLVLGITFCTELSKIPELNYNKKTEEIRQLLDLEAS